MASLISRSSGSGPNTAVVATSTVIATLAFLVAAKVTLWPSKPPSLASPLKAIEAQGHGPESKSLVYQPDPFPGARDVATPYGSMRVYEFGPEDGEKVLFVHGISTPCITLGPLANALAERGYRVMLFDLFGRGFSDGVTDLPHDSRLYTTQILLALASSNLAWTGSRGFRLVGYSMGGGITVDFAVAFPHLVSSLVLLAPAGLIRPESFGYVPRVMYRSGLIPERLLAIATRKRLQQPIAASRAPKNPSVTEPYVELAAAEAIDTKSDSSLGRLEDQVLEYVRWQVVHHAGFVPAFMSCIRYAPLTHQHESWRKLASRDQGTTAIFLAETDEIIDADEYRMDALPLVGGEDHVRWKVLPGSHDFIMTHVEHILEELEELWETEVKVLNE